MNRQGWQVYAAIALTGLAGVALWLGGNGWRVPEVRFPPTGPAPGEVAIRTHEDPVGGHEIRIPVGPDHRSAVEGTQRSSRDWTIARQLRFVDEHGGGVAAVEVYAPRDLVVWRVGEPWERIGVRSEALAVSDVSGHAEVSVLRSGNRYACICPGYRPTIFEFGRATVEPTEVVMRRSSGVLLRVLDETLRPVPGARLLLPAAALGWSTIDGEDAYYDVLRTDPSGNIQLWADLATFAPAVVDCDSFSPDVFLLPRLTEDGSITRVLAQEARIGGRVLDVRALNGPLAIVAECLDSAPPSSLFLPLAPVLADGAFSLERLSAGRRWVLTPCVFHAGTWVPCGTGVEVVAPSENVELAFNETFDMGIRAIDGEGVSIDVDVLISLMPRETLARSSSAVQDSGSPGARIWSRLPWPFGELDEKHLDLWLLCTGYESVSLESVALERGAWNDLGEHIFERTSLWRIQVITEDKGDAVSGATVRFIPDASTSAGTPEHPLTQEATTDDSGVVLLSCPEATPGILVVTADGYAATKEAIAPGGCEPLVVRVAPPGIVVVHCETVTGSPVPGTPVQWRAEMSSGWRSAASGSDGVIEVEVAAGDVLIRHAPGLLGGRTSNGSIVNIDLHHEAEGQPHLSQDVLIENVASGERRDVSLVVPSMSNLSVFLAVDGQPGVGCRLVGVPGTRLDIVDNDLCGGLQLPRAIVPSDGRVKLRGLPLGSIMLCAILPGTQYVDYLVIEVERQFDGAVHMDVETGQRVVEVLDRDGRGIAGAEIVLRQRSFQNGIRVPRMMDSTSGGAVRSDAGLERKDVVTADASGIARFSGVPVQGTFEASVVGSNERPHLAPAALGPHESRAILREGTGAALEVALRYGDGRPAAGVQFTLRRDGSRQMRSGTSDADGVVMIGGLETGTYRFWAGLEDARSFDLVRGQTLRAEATLVQ